MGKYETVETFICSKLPGLVDAYESYEGKICCDGSIAKSCGLVGVGCDKCAKSECLVYKEMKRLVSNGEI